MLFCLQNCATLKIVMQTKPPTSPHSIINSLYRPKKIIINIRYKPAAVFCGL